MAITLSEGVRSRKSVDSLYPEVRFEYIAQGTADDQELLTYLRANIPGEYEGLFIRSVSYEPEVVDIGANTGIWYVEALYTRPEAVGVDTTIESTEEFDTTGIQQKIFQSIQTIGTYHTTGVVANYTQGAIGFDGKRVNGVDITVPIYKFSLSYPLAASSITEGYKGLLFSCTGKVNDGAFKGFAAGEVLLLGVQGQRRGTGVWVVRFDFAASPNLTAIEIGAITVAAKKGWEYLWVLYNDVEVTAGTESFIMQAPKAAFVEQVYYTSDFAALGIGV